MEEELSGHPLFSCNKCRTPIALGEDLLSKRYVAKLGQAYLFSQVMNMVVGANREQQLMTGRFIIADIYCKNCGEVMGWKYLRAIEKRQKYKEGKFILEKAKILKEY